MWNRDSSKCANRALGGTSRGVGNDSVFVFFLKKRRGNSSSKGHCGNYYVVVEFTVLAGCRRAWAGQVRDRGYQEEDSKIRRRITDLSPLILRTCIPWPGPHGHLKPSITRPWSTISTDSLTSINLTIRWTPLYSYELDQNCSDAHSCTAVLRSESRLALSQYYCLSWQMCLRIGSR